MSGIKKEGFSVFPINNQAYRKRRKAFVACDQCKRARRRCVPDERGSQNCQSCQASRSHCSLNTDTFPGGISDSSFKNCETILPSKRPREFDESVFICSLDPKSELLATGNPDRDHIGVWVNIKDDEGGLGFGKGRDLPTIDRTLWNHLTAVGAFELPRKPERDALVRIYLDHVHPVCPLLHQRDFEEDYAANISPLPLLHAILMVASRDVRAAPILKRLHATAREFAAECETKIRALLYAEIEKNPLHLARVHCLLFFHSEGPEGFLKAAKQLSVSFHYAHSVAIHLRKSPGTNQEDTSSLWWTMWCFDKLSSCMNGGPLNSNAKDITVTLDEFPPIGQDAKRFVEACKLLDATIELYRPMGAQKPVADIVLQRLNTRMEYDASSTSALVRLIEIMAVILSCKRTTVTEITEPMKATLILRCLEVYDIVERYSSTLPPLPVLPYIVSLTFTVFLKFWNKGDIRFCIEWRRGVELLDTMSDRWWAAEAMSSMATKALAKLESNPVPNLSARVDMGDGASQPSTPNDDQRRERESLGALEGIPGQKSTNEVSRMSTLHDDFNLDDILFGRHDDASFFAQTELFGELDQGAVDYWFPHV